MTCDKTPKCAEPCGLCPEQWPVPAGSEAAQAPAEAHEKPVAFVRHTWNRSGARSLVFEKPDELSLAEEATGVEYEPLYAAAHARRPDAGAAVEARRYRRLQILGAAPFGSKNLDTGTVLRFQSLDAFVDADISAHPSRGESAQPEAAQPQPKSTEPLHLGACLTDGKLHATVMRREPNGHITVVATAEIAESSLRAHDCHAVMTPAEQGIPPLEEALKRAYYYDERGEWRGPGVDEWDRWHSVAKVAVSQAPAPAQRVEVAYLHRLSMLEDGKWIPATELIPGPPASEWVELAASNPDLWRVDRRVTGAEIARGIAQALQAPAVAHDHAAVMRQALEALTALMSGSHRTADGENWGRVCTPGDMAMDAGESAITVLRSVIGSKPQVQGSQSK